MLREVLRDELAQRDLRDPPLATVESLERDRLALIASIYIPLRGSRRTLGRYRVESNVAAIFVVAAVAAVTGSPWLLVLGLAGHGLKDLWQHRSQFVANTRWCPPFCLVIDWVAAAIIAVEIAVGVDFRG